MPVLELIESGKRSKDGLPGELRSSSAKPTSDISHLLDSALFYIVPINRIPEEDFSKVWPHEQCVVALPSQPSGVLICLNPRK